MTLLYMSSYKTGEIVKWISYLPCTVLLGLITEFHMFPIICQDLSLHIESRISPELLDVATNENEQNEVT